MEGTDPRPPESEREPARGAPPAGEPPAPVSDPLDTPAVPVSSGGRTEIDVGPEEVENGKRLDRALKRIDAAKEGLDHAVNNIGTPEAIQAATREYLAARDQMGDAMRPFGPPR